MSILVLCVAVSLAVIAGATYYGVREKKNGQRVWPVSVFLLPLSAFQVLGFTGLAIYAILQAPLK